MARVMFSCVGSFGHFHPLVALARALLSQGHEVMFVTAAGFAPRVTEAGFGCLPAGLDDRERRIRMAVYRPEMERVSPRRYRHFVFPRMFGAIEAPARVGDLGAAAARWRPEWLVHEPADYAAPVVAARLGVPSVNHSWGPAIPLDIVRLAAAEVAPLWQAAGLASDEFGGMYRGVYLDICPPDLQVPGWHPPGAVEPMRPEAIDPRPGEALPGWITGEHHPVLYVTLGTYFNQLSVFRVVLAGLSTVAAAVLVTVGADQDPTALGPQPANVHLARYVSQSLLLPHCAAVICHAGSNSILGAATHGLPLLCIPQGADQFDNAARCVQCGLGRQLLPGQLTPAAVTAAVTDVLSNPTYRSAAQHIQAQIRDLPPAAVVARRLFPR